MPDNEVTADVVLPEDMEAGLELARQEPGCHLKTQGDCNFAAKYARALRRLREVEADLGHYEEQNRRLKDFVPGIDAPMTADGLKEATEYGEACLCPVCAHTRHVLGVLGRAEKAEAALAQAERERNAARDQIGVVEARLAGEERAHEESMKQRDEAEEALGDAFAFVTGSTVEWSNVFGFDDATNEIAEKVKELEDRADLAEQEKAKLVVERDSLKAQLIYCAEVAKLCGDVIDFTLAQPPQGERP